MTEVDHVGRKIGPIEDRTRTPVAGIKLEFDPTELIEEIYVAPTAPTWVRDLVGRVAKKYQLGVAVVPSALDTEALY